MSYTSIEHLTQFNGKNILFLDLETTGLVTDLDNRESPENKYPCPTSQSYDNARVVEIGLKYYKNFSWSNIIDNIIEIVAESHIVKPLDFTIQNSHIHGISQDFALEHGRCFNQIIDDLRECILNCDFILGYNVFFDINVLLAELHKCTASTCDLIKKIENMKEYKTILCVGLLSSRYARPNNWFPRFKYHIPKQIDVYKWCFGTEPIKAHSAKFDVQALICITNYIYNKVHMLNDYSCGTSTSTSTSTNITSIIIRALEPELLNTYNAGAGTNGFVKNVGRSYKSGRKTSNRGKKWTFEENIELADEIKKGIPLDIIASNHKRTEGAIRMAINKISKKRSHDEII